MYISDLQSLEPAVCHLWVWALCTVDFKRSAACVFIGSRSCCLLVSWQLRAHSIGVWRALSCHVFLSKCSSIPVSVQSLYLIQLACPCPQSWATESRSTATGARVPRFILLVTLGKSVSVLLCKMSNKFLPRITLSSVVGSSLCSRLLVLSP